MHESKKRGMRCAAPVRALALSLALGVFLGASVTAQQPTTTETPTASTKTVTLVDGKETREIATAAATVGEMLAQEKAFPDADDRCSLPYNTPLKDGLKVVVTRIEMKKVVERIPLKHAKKEHYTSNLRAGIRQTVQAGKDGERVKTFTETYKNGEQTLRKKVAEKVTPPRPEVVKVGMRGMLASRGYFSGRRVIHMEATGYGPHCNGRWGARTASGLKPGYGVVAVDPRFIPLGTRLFIEGYGYAVAGDTGGAIKGARIDLGFDSHGEAVRTGRKRVQVLILD